MNQPRGSQSPLEKWKLGKDRLEKYEEDPDFLSFALVSIHGALEDQFRLKLLSSPQLSQAETLRVKDVRQVQWRELCDLMQEHCGLSGSDANYILKMNSLRTNVGHGGTFNGSYTQVAAYRDFVKKWLDETESLSSNNQSLRDRSLTIKSSSQSLLSNIQTFSDKTKSKATTRKKLISRLVYVGVVMALCVQFFYANHWQFLWFKSYEHAFATSFFLIACGVARTAQIWQNNWVALGIFITTIGGFAWKYKWILPIVKTDGLSLFVIGICVILYGLAPQLLGGILIIPGTMLLSVELWLMFTKGLAAIHSGNLLIAIILLGLSALMFRRQKKLEKTGIFRPRK